MRTHLGVATACASLALAVLPASASATPAGALDWGACPADANVDPSSGAQCATIQVPLDYSRRDGPRITVTVSRIAAGDPDRRRGVIFANPGGPGGDALRYWAIVGTRIPSELADQFDLIAVQPRGLRWSTPLDCRPFGAPSALNSLSVPGLTDKAECEARQPGYAETITTENTVRDMEEVRSALGEERINYLGASAGTYIGAVYATLFPQHVDKLVLDSSLDPAWVWQEVFTQQQYLKQNRLNDLFDWIAAHNAIYGLGATRADVYNEWSRQVFAQGSGIPATLAPGTGGLGALRGTGLENLAGLLNADQIGRLANALRTVQRLSINGGPTFAATSYSEMTRSVWPYLAQGMAEYRANPANMRFLKFVADLPKHDKTSDWVFSAITCNENAVSPNLNAIGDAARDIVTGSGFPSVSGDLVRAGITCIGWRQVATPVVPTGAKLAVRPLLLHSAHDARTPPAGGPQMAAAMGGHLITVAGGDHGVFGRREPIVDSAVIRYFETGVVDITSAPEAVIRTPNPPSTVPG